MLTKTQLKELLNVSVSKLEQLMQAAGISPDTTSFTEDQVSTIESIIESEQSTSTGKPKPRKGGSIARSENSKPVRGAVQQVQDVVTSRKRQGSTLGQQAAMAEVQGFTETYTGITQAFYTQLGAVSQAQIEATEGLNVDSDPLDYEAIAASFFDEEALSALPQGFIN
jgi:hypothetical protein